MAEPKARKGEPLFEYVRNAVSKKGFKSVSDFINKTGIPSSPLYRMREDGRITDTLLDRLASALTGVFSKAEFREIKGRNDAEIVKEMAEQERIKREQYEAMTPEERAAAAESDLFIKERDKNKLKGVKQPKAVPDRYTEWNKEVDTLIYTQMQDVKFNAVIGQIKVCLDEITQGIEIGENAEIINYGARWLREYAKKRKDSGNK